MLLRITGIVCLVVCRTHVRWSTVAAGRAGKDALTSLAHGRSSAHRICQQGFHQNRWGFPAVQGWYAWFLQHLVLPAAGFFSLLVTWGEVAVGLGILFRALTGIAAGFGVLMNLNFLLAGTVSTNPILGMFGLFLCLSWRVCGWIGIDRWLLPTLGLPWKPGVWFRSGKHVLPLHHPELEQQGDWG